MDVSVGDVIALAEHSLTGLMAFVMLIVTNKKLSELSNAITSLKEEVHLMREASRH